MTYPEALSYLGETRRFGMKLGLDSMRDLARRLGEPQKKLRFIHLAGTNGKGSTAAFCESCLRAAGFRVGLYTSPHLVSVRERFQINREFISEADFVEGMSVVRKAVAQSHQQEPTFFEITTALALWYFARDKVDWVVWETGLGGRLDATNIVDPEVCIITNIGLEHQQYLGGTLKQIAAEKAGIIKRSVPVVSAVENEEACEVLVDHAKAGQCALTIINRDMEVKALGLREGKQMAEIDGQEFAFGLIGSHQVSNAACAIRAMRLIQVANEAIAYGLSSTIWPGRFEILSEKPLIVLDGAHNPAGMEKLVETWRAFLAERKIDSLAHLVFASVADKDISEMAQLLRPIVKKVSLVRLASERTAEPAKLAESFSGLPCAIYTSVTDWWRKMEQLDPACPVLITGSLFLVGEMLARRHGDAGEYELNERLEKLSVK